MNILITAGGTREPIDAVREITNRSTGRLGRRIAERFLNAGATVTYIAGHGSEVPHVAENLTVQYIRSVSDLRTALEARLTGDDHEPFDVVFHSMAVSDYAPIPSEEKISSDAETLTLTLQRLPKIINSIKQWQPATLLVGFKLLANADEAALLQASQKLFRDAGCDYVLANDVCQIHGERHTAVFFASDDAIVGRAETKTEIAELLFQTLSQRTGQ